MEKFYISAGASLFIGFMLAVTVAAFIPDMRRVVGPILCADGELEQRLPISNRSLNLFCVRESGVEEEIELPIYALVATMIYAAIVEPLIFLAVVLSARNISARIAKLPPAPPYDPEAQESGAPRSAADRLAELDDLRRRGLVTDEEYRRKRATIIDSV
jgi:hypothetical protein